jgi:hypothetical protein
VVFNEENGAYFSGPTIGASNVALSFGITGALATALQLTKTRQDTITRVVKVRD